ncbi:MAG: VanZ family protein [Candidatus Electrothrix sp. ATG1]|nr:VanZ family protein [Candidatus Electrothrix sp. ATG1]
MLFFLQKKWRCCTIIFFVAITALSLWPESGPSAPGGDKLHHIIAYAALVLPVPLSRPKLWQFIAALFIVYSGVIELVQPLVHRYGEWLDMAANSVGVLCGILIAELLRRRASIKRGVQKGRAEENP